MARPASLLAVAMRVGLPCAVPLEENRAQRGAERQRIERRNDRRGGDRQGKLLEELAADAGHERRGNEHGAEHQRDGDHRPGDFGHCLPGGVARVMPIAK